MTIGVVYSPHYLEHNDPNHPEHAGRLLAIVERLRQCGAWDKAEHIVPQPVSRERLTSLHAAGYVEQVRQAAESGRSWHHPILGPLLADGPVGLASTYGVTPEELYADACHLCYSIRDSLRDQFPNKLGPGQMYGDYV